MRNTWSILQPPGVPVFGDPIWIDYARRGALSYGVLDLWATLDSTFDVALLRHTCLECPDCQGTGEYEDDVIEEVDDCVVCDGQGWREPSLDRLMICSTAELTQLRDVLSREVTRA